jgi:outer membrane protein TolC
MSFHTEMRSMSSLRTSIAIALVAAAVPVAGAAAQAPTASLTLAEALTRAEERSESVRIAEAAVLRARGGVYRARSQFLPQLYGSVQFQKTLISQFEEIAEAAGGAGGEEDNPLAKVFASENQVTLGLQANLTLFDGGRVFFQYNAANAGRDAATIGLASARAQVRLTVTEAYYDAILGDRLLVIAESSLVQTENALRETQLARQVGNTSEFDLLRARVTRDNQRPAVIQRRTQRDLAHLRLKQLLEIPLADTLVLTTDMLEDLPPAPVQQIAATGETQHPGLAALSVVDSVVAASDTTAEDRASVRQAREAVDAQRSLLRAARAQRLPALTVGSQYGRIAYPPSGVPDWDSFFNNWTVTVGLQLPLFTGGRIRGDELVAQADLIEARQDYAQAREYAALDARQAVAQLEEAESSWLASLGTAEQASRAYNIAEVRYREGISTQLELSESRILLQQAQANRAYAARNLQVARVRLALLPDLPLGGAAGQLPGSTGTQQPSQQTTPQPQTAGGLTQTGLSGGTF